MGVGAGLEIAGRLVSVDVGVVPSQGLARDDIGWSIDRDVVGRASLDARSASNWTRTAATILPFATSWLSSPGERWSATARRTIVYAEAMFVTHGLTYLGKDALSRPRPFVYLPVSERPADPSYDVATKHAFQSMPSGHASSAWTGAALSMTEHLLSRPDAAWLERAGVGFVGGALASAASALRVEAGQHFPSDVLAGAGIGIASGVALPLLHRGDRPSPPARAWLEMAAGALAGTLVGVVVSTQAY